MIKLITNFLFFRNILYIFAYMKTTEQFRNELYAKYGKRLIIPDDAVYLGNKKDIKVICPKHGVKWMRPNNLLSGSKCRECGYEDVSTKNSDTPQEFLKKAHKTHGDKYEYPNIHEEYGKVEKIHILCKKCGTIFEQKPAMHILGNGCSNCNPFPKKYTSQTLQEAITKKHPDIELISEYNGDNDSTIKVRCKKHNIEWETTPHRLSQQKFACEKCHREHRSSVIREKQEKLFNEFLQINYAPLYDISKVVYLNNKTKIKLICPTHGEFELRPDKMVNRLDGCPFCNESHLERQTRMVLDNLNIKYEREKTFDWLENKGKMFLDFYLPQYGVAIECQGEQHIVERNDSLLNKNDKFEDKVARDLLKNKLCYSNKIPIIYIFTKTHSSNLLNEKFNGIYLNSLMIEEINENNKILKDKMSEALN